MPRTQAARTKDRDHDRMKQLIAVVRPPTERELALAARAVAKIVIDNCWNTEDASEVMAALGITDHPESVRKTRRGLAASRRRRCT